MVQVSTQVRDTPIDEIRDNHRAIFEQYFKWNSEFELRDILNSEISSNFWGPNGIGDEG